MLVQGHFVLVFNLDTILSTHETLSDAVRAAVRHSSGANRGRYEIFKLNAPVRSGTMGDVIKWE